MLYLKVRHSREVVGVARQGDGCHRGSYDTNHDIGDASARQAMAGELGCRYAVQVSDLTSCGIASALGA